MRRRTFVKRSVAATVTAVLADFMKAFAAGEADTAVGKPLGRWEKGHFQVHFIYTGVAESMFMIYPDGTTLLLDVGDHPAHMRGKKQIPILPDMSRHAGEWISRYVTRVNPNGRKVDYFMLSHYHSDHGGSRSYHAGLSENGKYYKSGLGQAIDFLDIGKAIDRAYPTYDDPIVKLDNDDGYMCANLKEVYQEMIRRGSKVEKFRLEKGSDQLNPLHEKTDGFSIRPLCANGRIMLPDGTVKDLYKDLIERNHPKALNENGMSLGMVFNYGKFRFYTAGDFSDRIKKADGTAVQVEDLMAEACGTANVVKVNHHGHHSMFPELVKALKGQVYVACMWDQLHMTADTMERLADRNLYPEPRLLCPGVFTKERREEDAGKAWIKDIPETLYEPKHVVLDVPPGGETFKFSFVRAADESMTVESVISLVTRG